MKQNFFLKRIVSVLLSTCMAVTMVHGFALASENRPTGPDVTYPMLEATYPQYDQDNQIVYSWGTDYMGMSNLRDNVAPAGSKVVVAVIDTGLDVTNEYFKGRVSNDSYDFVTGKAGAANMVDTYESSHGTHVAGTIVDGTPSNVEIMALRAFGDDDTDQSRQMHVKDAFAYAIEHGADIINYSGEFENDGQGHGDLDELLQRAKDQNIVVVASSGNSGEHYITYPASSDLTIAVGSIGLNEGNDTLSTFSCYGEKLDFVAPGYEILSTVSGDLPVSVAMKSGTSMATPGISAAYAYLKMLYPEADWDTLYEQMKTICKDLGDAGKDIYFGWGVPNLSNLTNVHRHSFTYSKTGAPKGKHITACACGYEKTENCQNYSMNASGVIKCACGRKLASSFDTDTATLTVAAADKDFLNMRALGDMILNDPMGSNFWFHAVIEEGYTNIPPAAWAGNHNLEKITLPSTMEWLGRRAFAELYSNMTKIDMSKTRIHTIDDACFYREYNLKQYVFPKTLTSIGADAFEMGQFTSSIDLSNTAVSSIGSAAFKGCWNLERILFPKSLKSLGLQALSQCDRLKEVNLDHTQLADVDMHTFAYDPALEAVALPKTVKRIGEGAFDQCPELKAIYFMGDYPEFFVNESYAGKTFDGDTVTVYAPTGNATWNKVLANPENYQYGGDVTYDTFSTSKIDKISFNKAVFYYDGSSHYPKVTVKSGSNTMLSKSAYGNIHVQLTNKLTNKKPGTYTVKAQGRVDATGSLSKKYTIKIKPSELGKFTAGSKAFTAKWTKLASKYVSGYQLQYSTSKSKLSDNAGTKVTVSGASKSSKKIENLKKGKTYYVKLRTYKTIDGTKKYSAWSEVQKVKTK